MIDASYVMGKELENAMTEESVEGLFSSLSEPVTKWLEDPLFQSAIHETLPSSNFTRETPLPPRRLGFSIT